MFAWIRDRFMTVVYKFRTFTYNVLRARDTGRIARGLEISHEIEDLIETDTPILHIDDRNIIADLLAQVRVSMTYSPEAQSVKAFLSDNMRIVNRLFSMRAHLVRAKAICAYQSVEAAREYYEKYVSRDLVDIDVFLGVDVFWI